MIKQVSDLLYQLHLGRIKMALVFSSIKGKAGNALGMESDI